MRRAKPARAKPERFSHNDATRAEPGSTYAIEESEVASRKSTRKSSNRMKPDSALRLTAREQIRKPSNTVRNRATDRRR
jgi:hypothetical protein